MIGDDRARMRSAGSRRPRVLHVAAVDYTVRRLLLPQLVRLQTLGYDVRVSCGLSPGQEWGDLEQFDPANIAFPRSFGRISELSQSVFRLAALIRNWQPTVVHLHSPAAALPVRALPKAVLGSIKLAYTVHGYPHQWGSGAREVMLERLERALARRTQLMLFQSKEDFDQSRQRRYRTTLRYLGNGVGDEWFAGASLGPRSRGPLKVAYVGRVVREKGVIDLVRAVAAEANIHLTVIGDAVGSDRDSVMGQIRELTNGDPSLRNRVRYTGVLQPAEVRRTLSEVDVFCLPSYREGTPRSLIEAMAMGLPSVASRVRGCTELLADGGGILFPAGDIAALRAALRRLDSLTPGELRALGTQAQSLVDPSRREWSVFDRLTAAYTEIGIPPPATRTDHNALTRMTGMSVTQQIRRRES